jgi:hypothetical protein
MYSLANSGVAFVSMNSNSAANTKVATARTEIIAKKIALVK